jgi:hypothetical protein
VEQGGVEHRSSRPQQVVPGGEVFRLMTAAGVEKTFLRFTLPQSGQLTSVVSWGDLTKISTTLPHFKHLYSYIGIFLFSAGHFCPALGARNLVTGGASLMGNASSAIRANAFASRPQTSSSHTATAAAKTFPSASLTESFSLSWHLNLLSLITFYEWHSIFLQNLGPYSLRLNVNSKANKNVF